MQTTHLQQLGHILKFKRAAHQTQHVSVRRKSNAECKVYVTVLFKNYNTYICIYIYIYMHKFNYNKNKKRKHSLIFLKEIKEYNKTEPIVYHLQ